MLLKSGAEFTNAVIDLITGLILIPLIFILKNVKGDDKKKRKWLELLALLSLGDILGFLVHGFNFSELIFDILWIPLYAVMILIVLRFFFLAYFDYYDKEIGKNVRIIIDIIALVDYVICVVNGFLTVSNIYPYLIFAVIPAVVGFLYYMIMLFKREYSPSIYMVVALVLQLVGFYFQITRRGYLKIIWEFNCDGIYHIFLLITVVILFIFGLSDIKYIEKNNEVR